MAQKHLLNTVPLVLAKTLFIKMDAFNVLSADGLGVANIILCSDMKLKILTDRYGHNNDILQLQNEWLDDLFLYLGMDVEIFSQLEDNGKKVEYLYDFGIEIIKYTSIDGLQVFFDGDMVGEWGGPEYVMKIDENNEYYYEITIDQWTIKEEGAT